ncbi:carbohydrate kinase [Streptomyces sp. S07_1.15]|uniref:carbohydrate kinase family protein n=1 Tax=Streptomyces sp. S07_1.15 TaxID=2873925 RepID=UPI001D132C41|nr:carbohydrate kinase [Streptomyces sp. S07_1.15]MCC3654756.1 carbohydrate kinase [Streptomyces sp. S07_1.15]
MIVIAGEALIDLVPSAPPEPSPPGSGPGGLPALAPRLGGGPFNTALALGRLGARAAFCSRVSSDRFGTELLRALRADGVDTALVQRGPEPTTLAVAEIGADGSAGYRFYAEGTADRLFELPGPLPPDTRALSLGTCSLVLEPGASAYEALLRREAARGVLTALDPNIRAELIPDADAYRARFRSWLPSVGLVKLSVEDAEWLGGDPRAWLEAGPDAVVLTRGGDGLTVLTRDGEWSVPAEPVEVVDTIGAGDTVNAALLHRLDAHGALVRGGPRRLSGEEWRDVLAYASRAAAVTCSRAGARPPYAEELTGRP